MYAVCCYISWFHFQSYLYNVECILFMNFVFNVKIKCSNTLPHTYLSYQLTTHEDQIKNKMCRWLTNELQLKLSCTHHFFLKRNPLLAYQILTQLSMIRLFIVKKTAKSKINKNTELNIQNEKCFITEWLIIESETHQTNEVHLSHF